MMPHRPVHRLSRFLLLSEGLLLGVLLAVSNAQVPSAITPDGTLGTIVTPDGKVFGITGGTRPNEGPNLFHSFGQFDVGTGDTAHFVGQPGIENIIGRVTGGSESLIDGRLQSDANLFLLNPSGLMFGPNATLDVNGSFHASTADALHFADGATFSAQLNAKSTLTVAAPLAFGFLSANPADITIQESNLEVSGGKALSIVGGDIEIVGGRNADTDSPTLFAPGGRINLVSVASPGQVVLDAAGQEPNLDVSAFTQLGTIEIMQGAYIDTRSTGGGTVVIRGGRLTVDNASVSASTRDLHGAALGIDIVAAEDVVVANGSLIATGSDGAGNAGDIQIVARSLAIDNASLIGSTAFAEGRAGDIMVEVDTLTLTREAQITSSTKGPGLAGTVTVTATGAVTLVGADIFANAEGETAGAGAAGDITVKAGSLTLTEGSQIASSTFGPGHGGSVTVNVTDTITLQGTTPDGQFPSGIGATAGGKNVGAGNAGAVRVEAAQIIATDGALISSSTFGPGHGGSVTVSATGAITLVGADPVDGPPSGIYATTRGAGAAGGITIKAGSLTLTEGSQIASGTFGPGHGGSVTVNVTDTITLQGTTPDGQFPSGIIASAEGKNVGAGNAGAVRVEAAQIIATDGALISSSTFGPGHGGSVTVSATDMIALSGTKSGFFTRTVGSGQGGDIILEARQLQLDGGAAISVGSSGVGNAGDIRIAAQEVALRGGSTVTATVEQGEAGGGNIFIGRTITDDGVITEGVETLTLDDSRITADTDTGSGANINVGVQHLVLDGASALSANTGAGTGGNLRVAGAVTADGTITARADTVVLRGSKLTANAGSGTGGRIDIVTEAFLADPASDVDASSQAGGIDGVVNVEAAVSNLSEIVAPLPPDFASAAELLRDRCAARLHEGTVSSLVARGRASVPATPEGLLPSRLYQPDQASAAPPETEQQPAETDAPQQEMLAVTPLGRPQIIRGPFPAHAPEALTCNWTKP